MKENRALRIATAWKWWTPVHSTELAFWNCNFGISAASGWRHCPYSLHSVYIQLFKASLKLGY